MRPTSGTSRTGARCLFAGFSSDDDNTLRQIVDLSAFAAAIDDPAGVRVDFERPEVRFDFDETFHVGVRSSPIVFTGLYRKLSREIPATLTARKKGKSKTAELMVLASCKMKDTGKAKSALSKVTPIRRGAVKKSCKAIGVSL